MAKVKLDWVNSVANTSGIEVWRDVAAPPTTGVIMVTLPPGSTSWTDIAPPLGPVSYRVRAVAGTEIGAWTSWVTITVTTMVGTLSTPTATLIP